MFDFRFDPDTVINDLGLEKLPREDKAKIIEAIKEQLELQVRVRLTALMDTNDHAAFAKLAVEDPIEAKHWLDQRFPESDQLYKEELSDLIRELKHRADFLVDFDKNQ